MVEVRVGDRNNEVMMLMSERGQTLAEFSLVVVVNVGQTTDRVRRVAARQTRPLDAGAQQVTHRLRAIGVTLASDQFIELGREPIFE